MLLPKHCSVTEKGCSVRLFVSGYNILEIEQWTVSAHTEFRFQPCRQATDTPVIMQLRRQRILWRSSGCCRNAQKQERHLWCDSHPAEVSMCGQQAGSPPGFREQQVGCERWEGALPQRPEDIAPLLRLAGPLVVRALFLTSGLCWCDVMGKQSWQRDQEQPHVPGSHLMTSKQVKTFVPLVIWHFSLCLVLHLGGEACQLQWPLTLILRRD